MSVCIHFRNVVKRYDDLTIIPGLSLSVKEGEFFTLLGPSGCGKTTLLRMVAGFNTIEGGDIAFNDEIINDVPPGRRNIGMVFQNYAIFPHMTVRQNVAFGLGNRHVPKEESGRLVEQMLNTVKIRELAARMPDKLSGGQQQRVALARAIVIRPAVLLMDEPLSNLDAKLRIDMRNAIKSIQREVGITTLYVTHDQEEAMAISDRIAVMNAGVIQHVGTPRSIYQRPANLFVASFIGRSNVLDATLVDGGAALCFGGDYTAPFAGLDAAACRDEDGGAVKVSVRPEEFALSTQPGGIPGTVQSSVFMGLNTTYFIALDGGQTVEAIEESSASDALADGTRVYLHIKPDKVNLFCADGSRSLTRGVQNDAQA
ncbi:MAG: ABC transporter ATP-binding protein [Oscillospiraceae bacterium]|nr:ABC transporter ATP-binding protein [Oscillospiraceae bacterium]